MVGSAGKHVLSLDSVECSFPSQGGINLRINATKPKDFSIKQARLKIVGDEFWKVLSKVIGSAVIATFRLALHPLILCPDHLSLKDITKGKEQVSANILFGSVGKFRVKRSTVLKKLKAVITQGDPTFVIELEYGERFVTFSQQGFLCSVRLRLGDVIDAIENERSLLPSHRDAEGHLFLCDPDLIHASAAKSFVAPEDRDSEQLEHRKKQKVEIATEEPDRKEDQQVLEKLKYLEDRLAVPVSGRAGPILANLSEKEQQYLKSLEPSDFHGHRPAVKINRHSFWYLISTL
eukprot:TRINITY_DN10001_c0_g1_i1.p1 TRINITY_DN10001_c0_g1~~TRINITY_DN10001_c0_g1_i1.p1  ORF type:complete len:291 (-),score=64.78 TRINITY_DN10001_c0_g1_i1:72-944(-)